MGRIKALVGVSIAVALVWGGWEWRDRSADLEMQTLKTELAQSQSDALWAALDAERQAEEAARRRASELAATRAQYRQREDQLNQEIDRYEKNLTAIERECRLTARWVRQADKAQRGPLPRAVEGGRELAGDTGGITCVRALRVITASAAQYHRVVTSLKALQAAVVDYRQRLKAFRREHGPER